MTAVLDSPSVPGGRALRLLAPAPAGGGRVPALTADDLVRLLADAGLIGHGGAGFPTWRKIAAAAEASTRLKRPVVVANGSEGEPASRKDVTLLSVRPDLVLDGLGVLASALQASEAHLVVADAALADRLRGYAQLRSASGRDRLRVQIGLVPDAFLSGEETAVSRWLAGGPAVPQDKDALLVRRGLRGRPTVVQNVETLAHLAQLAGYGAAWYRSVGTADEPGTRMFSVSGAVASPGVVEAPGGLPLLELLDRVGGPTARLSAVLAGGYGGGWIGSAHLASTSMSRQQLAAQGAALGAGIVVALPASACGLRETARVTAYLASSGAQQCGPCLNGLPRLAELMSAVSRRPDRDTVAEIYRIAGLVEGRGACHHPNGTVRLVRSSLRVFSDEIRAHVGGRCTATRSTPVLPV